MIWNKWVGKHFRKPRGLLGRWAANFMEKNNRGYYDQVARLLEITDEDRILEIGFGSGLAIRRITEQNPACMIEGLDFSPLMLGQAEKNNRRAITQNQVRLHLGNIRDFCFNHRTFTKIFGINVLYFWDDLDEVFSRLHGLLEPGGRMILFMSSPERLSQLPFAVEGVFNKYPVETVMAALRKAGFVKLSRETVLKKGLETYYVCAGK